MKLKRIGGGEEEGSGSWHGERGGRYVWVQMIDMQGIRGKGGGRVRGAIIIGPKKSLKHQYESFKKWRDRDK